jgi:hypothetical protein
MLDLNPDIVPVSVDFEMLLTQAVKDDDDENWDLDLATSLPESTTVEAVNSVKAQHPASSSPKPKSEAERKRRKASSKVRRQKSRQKAAKAAEASFTKYATKPPHLSHHIQEQMGDPIPVDFDVGQFDSTGPGFVANGLRADKQDLGKTFELSELVDRGFRVIPWEGR